MSLFELLCQHIGCLPYNFYILDYSSRMLLPFENAPHCGGVIIDTDEDKVKKFFFMLEGIIQERKQLFRGGSFTQYVQSGKGKGMTAIMIVIDNYANFREKTGNKYDEEILRISREGIGYGIFLVLSSGGFGSNEIPTRVADNIKTVVSLEMGDKFKYSEVLRTTRVEVLPEADVKGRGLAYVNGTILEFHTALAVEAENAYECGEKIEKLCKDMKENWKGECAKQIPVIPEKPTIQLLAETTEYEEMLANNRYLPFGYKEKDASVYGVDLWNSYCYTIQGKTRTGRKNMLKLLAYAATRKKDARVCIIDIGGQELKKFATQHNIEYIADEAQSYEFFKGTIPLFKERNQKKRAMIEKGVEEEEMIETMNKEPHIYIFIVDMVAFVQSVYKVNEGVGSIHPYMENISEKGSHHGFYFFSILNPDQAAAVAGRKLYMNMISYKTGIHLGGNVTAQRLFQFNNIPFQEQSKVTKPGKGLVPSFEDPNASEAIIIPVIKGDVL